MWRELGFASVEGFRQGFVQAYFLPMDPNNLLCQARKWREADVGWRRRRRHGDGAGPDHRRARSSWPSAGDAFFPPEDVEADAANIPGAEFRVVGSGWGHFTMFDLREQDTRGIDALYAEILAS